MSEVVREVEWRGRLGNCQICRGPFNGVMYDSRTIVGQWGNICQGCFITHGTGLGTGLGQRYELREAGRWVKTAG